MPRPKQGLSFKEAWDNLDSRIVMPVKTPSLTPMKKALERVEMDLDSWRERIIVVAGTNGKGSVSKTLEQLLLAAGSTPALYTSPHFVDIRERIRIGGKNISQDLFARAFNELEPKVCDLELTHFEMLTLMAAWCFFEISSQSPDWAIFEVGMGGRWDATNALPHATSVVTRIAMDHQEFLGDNKKDIVANKLGVVGSQNTVIHVPFPIEADQVVHQVRADTQSRFYELAPWDFSVRHTSQEPVFELSSQWGKAPVSLPGTRGLENAALALQVFAKLGFAPGDYLHVLNAIDWPGRMSRHWIPGISCPVYFSGDHNVAGACSLIELLSYFKRKHIFFLVGLGVRKPLEILEWLEKVPESEIWLTQPQFLGRQEHDYGIWKDTTKGFYSSPKKALFQMSQQATAEDMIVVTGSLYLVGDLLGELTLTEESGRLVASKGHQRRPL